MNTLFMRLKQRQGAAKATLPFGCTALAVLLILCFSLTNAYAGRYALLIGIGEYKNGFPYLSGPINDVKAFKKILGQHDFNISLLENKMATRQQIKNKLEYFSRKLKKGDYFVFYFSGHGTSRYDNDFGRNLNLPYQTGALVPYDAKPSGTENLFISCRDLRPYIEKMDQKGVQGFGIIDACFSGESYRSFSNSPFNYRYTQIDTSNSNVKCNMKNKETGYPYKNFVFMVASGRNEKALDLDRNDLMTYSYGGINHGAFSSMLFKALDNNKMQTYETLFENISDAMGAIPNINHSPLLHPDEETPYYKDKSYFPANNLYKKNVFGARSVITQRPAALNNLMPNIHIDITFNNARLRAAVSQTAGVKLYKPADLLVIQKQGKYQLTDIHKTVLYTAKSLSEMEQVIKQQGWINKIKQAKNTQQPYKIRASVKNYQGPNSNNLLKNNYHCKNIRARYPKQGESNETFLECDLVEIKVKAEKPSYLLVLHLAPNGEFELLYPYNLSEYQSRQKQFKFPNLIIEPIGQDMVLTFAFKNKRDPLYQQIEKKLLTKRQTIKPNSALHKQIIKRFTHNDPNHAQHIKSTISVARH